MSGSGRKSQYRKSVTSTYLLEDERTPQDHEYIVSIVGNRGDSTFAIQFPTTTITSNCSSSEAFNLNTSELANLPKKFNKLIWIKTGDHVIVEDNAYRSGVASKSSICNTDSVSSNTGINTTVETVIVNHSKVRFTITHILSKNNIKYLKINNLWPFIKNDQIEDVHGGKALCKDMHILMPDDRILSLRDVDECGDEYEDAEPEVYDSMGNTIINSN